MSRTERTDDDWVWRYGMREARFDEKAGQWVYDPRPLTREEFIHPQEGDRLLEVPGHTDTVDAFRWVMSWQTNEEEGTHILGKAGLDFGIPGLRAMCADLSLHRGLQREVPRWDCPILLPALGGRVDLVVEVTRSLSRDVDLVDKVPLYHQGGVGYYLMLDHGPEGVRDFVEAILYRWTPERFVRVEPTPTGRIWIDPLAVLLETKGDRFICYDLKGRRIPTMEECWEAQDRRKKAAREEAELAKLRPPA